MPDTTARAYSTRQEKGGGRERRERERERQREREGGRERVKEREGCVRARKKRERVLFSLCRLNRVRVARWRNT